MGVGAHALDELQRPARCARDPERACCRARRRVSVAGAVAIGIAAAVGLALWLLAFVAVGGFLVVAYNLELFGGRSTPTSGSGSPGARFPVLTAYFAMARG